MQKTTISMEVSTSSAVSDIFLTVLIDDYKMHSEQVQHQPQLISFDLEDTQAKRCLQIIMTGKTCDHTKIGEDGTIIDDVLVSIKNISFDGINIDKLAWQLAEYQHDFNGSGQTTSERFYGTIGCNGTVTLKFDTPIYTWLLENM